jgi:hypothetical protein
VRNGWEIAVFFTKEVPPNNNRGASSAELVRIALASSVAAIATMNRVETVLEIDHSCRRCSGMGWILLYSCIALSVALTATMSPVQYVLESDHCRRCCSGLG